MRVKLLSDPFWRAVEQIASNLLRKDISTLNLKEKRKEHHVIKQRKIDKWPNMKDSMQGIAISAKTKEREKGGKEGAVRDYYSAIFHPEMSMSLE